MDLFHKLYYLIHVTVLRRLIGKFFGVKYCMVPPTFYECHPKLAKYRKHYQNQEQSYRKAANLAGFGERNTM